MAVNIKQFMAAGLDRIHWGVLNGSGYVMGTSGSISNGSDASAGLLVGAKTADLTLPEAEQIAITGDDGKLGSFQFSSTEVTAFTLEMAASDFDLVAKAQGSAVRALGDWSMSLLRPYTLSFSNITLLLISQAQSAASGSLGSAGFAHLLLPSVQMVYLGRSGIAERGAQNFRFACLVNTIDKWPWGQALVEGTDGDTKADGVEWFAENRVAFHTHVSNASDTEFTLTYTPAEASSDKAPAWRNGAALTYTTDYTLNTGTKVVTLQAAGTAGDVVNIFYEYTS